MPLTDEVTVQSAADISFESRIEALSAELDVDVEADEVVSHDTKHAVVNVAADRGVDAIVAEHEPLRLRSRLLGDPVDWIVRHAPCDVVLVDNLGYDEPNRVALAGDRGPFPPLAVTIAESIAGENRGAVSLWQPIDQDGTAQYERTIEEYQSKHSELLSLPVRAEPIGADALQSSAPDVVIRRGTDDTLASQMLDDRATVPHPGCTTISVYPHESHRPRFSRRLLERLTF